MKTIIILLSVLFTAYLGVWLVFENHYKKKKRKEFKERLKKFGE